MRGVRDTNSPLKHSCRYHHMFHAPTTISYLRPAWLRICDLLQGQRNSSSSTMEPDQAIREASSMISRSLKAAHTCFAQAHVNIKCRISFSPTEHTRHWGVVGVCVLARSDNPGTIPCKAFHAKISLYSVPAASKEFPNLGSVLKCLSHQHG